MRTLFLVLMAWVWCVAQPKFPDTPAARQFVAWLTAFNDPDPAVFQRFSEKNFPKRQGDKDQDRDFREQTGGFEFELEDLAGRGSVALNDAAEASSSSRRSNPRNCASQDW